MLAAVWELLASHPLAALVLALLASLGVVTVRLRHARASESASRQAAEAADLRRRLRHLHDEAERRRADKTGAVNQADAAHRESEDALADAADAAKRRQDLADRWRKP